MVDERDKRRTTPEARHADAEGDERDVPQVVNRRTVELRVRLDIDVGAWERKHGPATLTEIREYLKQVVLAAVQRPGVIADQPDAIFEDIEVAADSAVRVARERPGQGR